MILVLLMGAVLAGVALAFSLRLLFYDHGQGEAIVARVASYTGARDDDGKKGKESSLSRFAATALGRFGGHFDLRRAQGQLTAAGLYSVTPQRLLGYRFLALAILPGSLLLLGSTGALSGPLTLVATTLAVVIAWRLPAMQLRRRTQARAERIDRELPVLVDLLVVTVEAGVGLGASLQLTADQVRGPLRDELRLAVREQQMGLTTYEALANFQRRCPTPAVTSFVRALVQGEQLGVSIGKIMRDLAVEMRSRRRAAAEERAQQAPIKMLFPLIFLIFPALLVVLLGPGLMELMKALGE